VINWKSLEVYSSYAGMAAQKKTEIVYEANLNFKNAAVYLKLLIDQKMIIKEALRCFMWVD
jgi:predicted transcriptional regulator